VFAAGFPAPDPRRLLSWPPLGVWGDCSVAASPEEGFERSCVFGPMADGADAPKQFGITKPLSLLGPVEADLQRTAELEKFLVEAGLYESAEESAKREEVLGKLDQDGVNQLMGKVWDWNNMYGTNLKKFDGSVLAANEDGGRCEDDVTALREDHGDDPKDGSSGPESSADIDDWQDGHRVVQFLAISANFPICAINGYDGEHGRCIYAHSEGEVQEDGMVDLVPIGPCELLMAYGAIGLEIFYYTTARDEGHFVREDEGRLRPLGPRIIVQWNVDDNDEIEGYTKTISPGPGRDLEITYLVIPTAVQTSVEVRLKLKDLGYRSRAVYGKIKANAIDYRNKRVHLFSCDRGRCLSFPSGTTSILPLSPSKIALPCSRLLKFHIEVDLIVITTCESHEEDKNLKFSLEFTRGITSQEREVDDDRVQVEIKYDSEY